jgi:hypothetical protein
MASAAIQSTMTTEEFHSSKEWKSLTEGQKRWVTGVIDHGDARRATAEAYASDDPTYVSMFTRKIESSANVIAALDVFYKRTERERFIRDLRLNISQSDGIAKIESQKLLARILGLVGGSESEQLVCKVGDVVLANGVKHRVTAVDANGRPTDGEPL